MQFENRHEAGKLLADKLFKHQYEDAVVLSIPRGGVPVGYEISQILHAPLNVVITRKVGHPQQPEFAVCAVTENRYVLCDERIRRYIDKEWLKAAIDEEQKEAKRRRLKYNAGKDLEEWVTDKDVILVDDGIATGLTMLVAVRELKSYKPKSITIAVPVMSKEAYRLLENEADAIVALHVPEYFGAVGVFYKDFNQVSDEDVTNLLRWLNSNMIDYL